MHGFISGLSILFHWSIFLFLCQYYTFLMTVALWYNLKSGSLIPVAPFFSLIVVLQNRFVGYFAMVKNIYNLTLPPIKKLTIKKIVIYSIHGKCSMYNWRNGQEGQCSYYLGGFSHHYIHRQSQLIAVSRASCTSSSPWNCPLALYCYGHLVSIVQLLSHI